MSLTIEGAVKAWGEQLALGMPWFNTFVPINTSAGEPQKPRYVVVGSLDLNAQRTGSGRSRRSRQLLQLDLYQTRKQYQEQPNLGELIYTALTEAVFPTAPKHVYRVEDVFMTPVPDPTDPETVHQQITGTIRRRT